MKKQTESFIIVIMNINIKDTDTVKYAELVRKINASTSKKAYVLTFGCQQNEADSERIRGMAGLMGYSITDNPEEADLIVINTCAVRQHAELKALSILGGFKALKKSNPELIVAVVGCMAAEAHIAEKIKKSYPYVSFTLEPTVIYKFPELVWKAISEKKRSFIFNSDVGIVVEGIEPVRTSGHKAWVSIMYGCNNFCSYCIVPYVRGRERSRDSQEIIKECRELVDSGCREITLLGQNVNSYKYDMDFASLIEAIANIPGDFIIRFMTSHPKDVSDRLIEVFGKYSGKIAPAFHLPLQSGSNGILRAMNRTYDVDKYLSTVEKIRGAVPDVALTSDIIVGFPGEREEDFIDTLNLLSKVRFDMVYSFIYSVREGTRAATMDSKIPDAVKSERMGRLLDLQRQISYEKNLPYVDTVQRVLVDSLSKNGGPTTYTARTATNKLVHFDSDENLIGKFVNLKIVRAGAFDLFGERLEREN